MIEVVVSSILVLVLLFIINPLDFFMPSSVQMSVAGIAVVLFGLFASFILKEKSVDEREDILRSNAGRSAFLVGAGFMMVGIVVGVYRHDLDVWLPVSLVSMVLAKLYTRFNMK